MDFITKLIAQLDQDKPMWYTEWATSRELAHYASNVESITFQWERMVATGMDPISHLKESQAALKRTVANRLFHRILNAGISCGIVSEINQ